MKEIILVIAAIIGLGALAQAQDVEALTRKDSVGFFKKIAKEPFSLQGAYGANMRSYSAFDVENRQTPLTTTLYANATANLYGISIPINFVLNNLDGTSHPFTRDYFSNYFSNQRNRLSRLGLSPHYRWIKTHIGHRYMNFSDFTLSNHNFLGGGVELTPGKLRFAAMAGQLAKAEPLDLALGRPNLPIYTRTGWGMKVGYGTATDFVDLIVFNAKDDPRSLDMTRDSNAVVLPGENIVWGVKGRKMLLKNLSFDFDAARSGFTRNREDPQSDAAAFFLYDNGAFRRRTSTSYANAAAANLRYQLRKISLGLGYRRIDPQYRTFGAYFFNDDLEDYTLQVAGYGLGRFSFAGNAGLQRNNLDQSKPATYRRFIGALNASYQLESWMFGLNYSNFQSNIDYFFSPETDSLKVVIITSDASLNISKTFMSGKGIQHGFMLMGGAQMVNQNIETPTGDPATAMYYANFSYNLRLPSRWHCHVITDYNNNAIGGLRQIRYGLGGRIGKSWFNNKLDVGLGSQFYDGRSEGSLRDTRQTNSHLRVNWRISRMQTLQAQTNWIQSRRRIQDAETRFSEVVGTIGFNAQFGYNSTQKKAPNPGARQNGN